MRIIFIGAVAFSRSALERLIEIRAGIVGVCTLNESSINADGFREAEAFQLLREWQ
jgi:methionyl-tRNA formyltransferase